MAFDPRELAEGILEEFASSSRRPHRYERLDRVFRRSGELSGKPFDIGVGNRNAKLSVDRVIQIRESTCSDRYEAGKHGVSVWTVKAIRRWLVWDYLEEPTPRQPELIGLCVDDDDRVGGFHVVEPRKATPGSFKREEPAAAATQISMFETGGGLTWTQNTK